MNNYKIIALDESGKASYAHHSELFVLSSVIISEKFKPKLDRLMRKLKFKYFKDAEIVFHSRDMYRAKGPFSTLRDNKKTIDFWSEFISIANSREISLSFIIVNKDKARKNGWQPKTILKRCYLKILEEYATKQLKLDNGKIISESDPSQDLYLIQAHNRLQSMGSSGGSITALEYKKKITSLSLVNKSNLDIDVQLADALAPIAGMIYLNNTKLKIKRLNKIEKMKKRLIDRKIQDKTNPSIFEVLI
nr:hypothetical protein [Candidatus Levybacteria bacterium]